MDTTPASPPAAAAPIGDLIRLLLRDGNSCDAEAAALLHRLDASVRVYEREFRAFLNGQAPRPPLELQSALDVTFAELGQHAEGRCDFGFHLDVLEARFNASQRLLVQRLTDSDRRPTLRLLHAS